MPLTVKTGAMKVKDPSSGNYVDVDMSLGVDYAPINSPEFAGTPKAPTATSETNNTQIATTAFVQGLVSTEASARQAADSALQGSLNTKLIKLTATLNSSVTSATIASWSNQTGITENSFVVEAKFSNPTAILSNITVTKDTGSVVLTGTTGASAGTIELIMGNE